MNFVVISSRHITDTSFVCDGGQRRLFINGLGIENLIAALALKKEMFWVSREHIMKHLVFPTAKRIWPA